MSSPILMHFTNTIRQQARDNLKRIILPEWEDSRILQAVSLLVKEKIALPVLVGDASKIVAHMKAHHLNPQGIEIIDFPKLNTQLLNKFSHTLREKYAKKTYLNDAEVSQLLQDKLHQGALLLDARKVDGMVAGINTTTADVIKTSIRMIGLSERVKIVSSFFVMVMDKPHERSIKSQLWIFADCAVVVEPTSEQLVDICLATVKNTQAILQAEPNVAMLSFSTEGSAQHPQAQKVAEATQLIKQIKPDLNIVGEIQFDAAICREIAEVKLKHQKWSDAINIFIFPDLNSANIGYKIAQRLGKINAIGPILQGFRLPVNDLSRGASVEDIVDIVALTSVQCQ